MGAGNDLRGWLLFLGGYSDRTNPRLYLFSDDRVVVNWLRARVSCSGGRVPGWLHCYSGRRNAF